MEEGREVRARVQHISPCRCSDAGPCPQPPQLIALNLNSCGACRPIRFARHQAPLLPPECAVLDWSVPTHSFALF